MSERIILLGADAPGLDAAHRYLTQRPKAQVSVIYPECNPLPELSCDALENFLRCGLACHEEVRAIGLDIKKKQLLVRDVTTGKESGLEYDKLIINSGAAPADLDATGYHGSIVRIGTNDDVERLRATDGKTLVVGGGPAMLPSVARLEKLGRDMVEVVIPAGSKDTPLSDSLMGMVYAYFEKAGIPVHLDQHLERLERADGKKVRLVTAETSILADRVINTTQSLPITEVLKESGLSMDQNGGIVVDSAMRTSAPDVFACGSCAAFLSDGCKVPIAGVSVRASEPRQAGTLAATMAGISEEFRCHPSAYSVKMNDLSVAGSGLTVEQARACGFEAMSAMAIQFDRAHFMPGVELMTLELVFDGPTRRVLGIHGLGRSGDALCGRISAVSAILSSKPTIDDVANLEVAYSPPFSSAMDTLNTVANVADNMLAGINEPVTPAEFRELWAEREHGDHFFIDCRELGNAQPLVERYPLHWNHIPQGEIARRIHEVPKDKKTILICNSGTRSYEAQVAVRHAGIKDVCGLEGGMIGLRQSGIKI